MATNVVKYSLVADVTNFKRRIKGSGTAMEAATIQAGRLSATVLGLGASYAALTEDAVRVVDQVNTMAASSGLAADTVNGLRLAAEASGKAIGDLVPEKLGKRILETSQGTGEALSAFKALGVETKKANGELRTADEIYLELVDKLLQVENAGERAGLATIALGKQGAQALSAFGNVGDLERYVELGRSFGYDVGPQATASTGEWQRATAGLSLTFEELGQDLLDLFGGAGSGASYINSFALGLIYVSEVSKLMAQEVIKDVQTFAAAAAAVLVNWNDPIATVTALTKIADDAGRDYMNTWEDLKDAHEAALAEAAEFYELAAMGTKAATESTKEYTGTVDDAADAVDRLRRAEQLAMAARAAAAASTATSQSDQLDAYGKMDAARDAELMGLLAHGDALAELHDTGVDVFADMAAVNTAMLDVMDRNRRDHQDQLMKDADDMIAWSATASATMASLYESMAEDVVDGLSTISTALNNRHEQAMGVLQSELDMYRDLLKAEEDQDSARAKWLQNRIAGIESETREQRKAAKKTHDLIVAAAIAQIAIDAAKATISIAAALAPFLGPGAPLAFGIAAGVVATAVGVATLAIESTPPPTAHSGSPNVDEGLHVLRSGEAVLSQRGVEAMGRSAIGDMNTGSGGGGGGGAVQLHLDGRALDVAMARVLRRNGAAARVISTGRSALALRDPYGRR